MKSKKMIALPLLKHCIALFLVCLLAFGALQTGFASENQNSASGNKEIFILESLGVFDSEFETSSSYVTRGQMAMLAVRLMGVTTEGTYVSGFSDVTPETKYAWYIESAKSLGIMNGSGDIFSPERFVSGYEAVKTIVSALGYDVVAAAKGGWHTGYVICASELGLLKYTQTISSDAIKTDDVITILCNALRVKPLNPIYSSDLRYEKENFTLGDFLESKNDISYVEGIVNSVDDIALYASTDAKEGYIRIGNKNIPYKDFELDEYLAYPVSAYTDKWGNLKGICKDSDKFSQIILSPADAEIVSLNEVTYYVSDSKKQELSIAGASIIYNGKPIFEPKLDDVAIRSGKLRFINNDDDKAIEAVFVEESISVCTDTVYEPNNSVYFKSGFSVNGRSSISFDFDNDNYSYAIIKPDGTPGTFADIKSGMAMTIIQSKDGTITKISLSDKTISGTLDGINSSEGVAIIDGEEYELALNESGIPWLASPLGTKALFLLDADDRIVCEAEETIGDSYAYVCAISNPTGLSTPKIQLRTSGKSVREEKEIGNSIIVSYKYQNGESLELDFASKLKLNGDAVSLTNIPRDAIVGKLIKYKLDSEGKIKTIESFDSYNERASMNFNAQIVSFGGRAERDSFLVGSTTKVICIPNIADSEDDWNQTVKCVDDGSYMVYGAEIDEESNIAGAVLIYADMDADALVPIDDDTKISIVVSSTQVIDNEGDAVYRVRILTGSEEKYIMTGKSQAAENAVSKLKAGNLIRYSTDVDDRIANLELLASISELDRFYRANANSTNEEIYGRVTNVEVNRLSRIKNEFVDKVTIATNEWLSNGVSYELVQKDGPTMYICNIKAKTVRSATGFDMMGSNQFGIASSSKVLMLVKNNDPQVVVVIE